MDQEKAKVKKNLQQDFPEQMIEIRTWAMTMDMTMRGKDLRWHSQLDATRLSWCTRNWAWGEKRNQEQLVGGCAIYKDPGIYRKKRMLVKTSRNELRIDFAEPCQARDAWDLQLGLSIQGKVWAIRAIPKSSVCRWYLKLWRWMWSPSERTIRHSYGK